MSLFQNFSRALKQPVFLTNAKKRGKNTIFRARNKAVRLATPYILV
jgi:hypothetical protein